MSETQKVHVKFFAIFREMIGVREEWTEIEPGMTVEQLWLRYVEHAPNSRVTGIRAAYSVNRRLARPDTVLEGGEEIGFLPPVSGGQDKSFFVTSQEIKLSSLIEKVEHPGAGAIVTFTGVVRDNAHERSVQHLEYEAYDEMAEQTLTQIGDEACARWNSVRLAMAHRTGRLEIGQASVMIAVSSPHRAEAFAACRYAIERIKAVLPVWKKEFASDDEYWVEGPVPGEMTPEQAEEIAGKTADG